MTDNVLPVLHAGSLGAVVKNINALFLETHPGVEVKAEPAGSADAVRKITRREQDCGVIASADYRLIEKMMVPGFTDWYLIFASNQMVVRYTDRSPFSDEINSNNWHEIFLREGVNFWRFDADGDPGGYRALLVMQLAEHYYRIPGLYQKLMASPNNHLLTRDTFPQMASGYSFGYGLTAGGPFKTLALPEEINLSNPQLEQYYTCASVEITGNQPEETITIPGGPIFFGLTIPKGFHNQNLAADWVSLLLGEKGSDILRESGMSPVSPPIYNDKSKTPAALIQ